MGMIAHSVLFKLKYDSDAPLRKEISTSCESTWRVFLECKTYIVIVKPIKRIGSTTA